jgi:hypothetical protein
MLAARLGLGTSYRKVNFLEAFVSFTYYRLNSKTVESDRSLVAPICTGNWLKVQRTK